MRATILALLVLTSGCAPRYRLVSVEAVGPVQVEVWQDRQRQICERRVYLDSYYYRGEVPCVP